MTAYSPASAPAATASEVVARFHDASIDELNGLLDRYKNDPRKAVQKARMSAEKRLLAYQQEKARVSQLYTFQQELAQGGVAVGIDEVGRGALAGPLTVCALILPASPQIMGLNDSKQLTAAKRESLSCQILDVALAVSIVHIAPSKIDEVGMARALRLAMGQAIDEITIPYDAVLIDGNPMHLNKKEICVVKGDAKVSCIAAASIVAKVTRDALMIELAEEYPGYHLDTCKGYGSAEHIAAIENLGLCEIHRRSFCTHFQKNLTLF